VPRTRLPEIDAVPYVLREFRSTLTDRPRTRFRRFFSRLSRPRRHTSPSKPPFRRTRSRNPIQAGERRCYVGYSARQYSVISGPAVRVIIRRTFSFNRVVYNGRRRRRGYGYLCGTNFAVKVYVPTLGAYIAYYSNNNNNNNNNAVRARGTKTARVL